MIAPGQHPKDHVRLCACGIEGLHTYEGTSIADAETVGLLDVSGDMHEAVHVTCTACGVTYTVAGVVRPDLDGESFGWVTERRTPSSPHGFDLEGRDTVPCPPPTFEGES